MTSVTIPLQQQNFLLIILFVFFLLNDVNLSEFHLNSDSFIFSRKAVKASHSAVFLNDIPTAHCSTQKTFGYEFG